MIKLLLAAIVVGTWNAQWFPSGRAKHRAHPAVEAATIQAAGALLRQGVAALDPRGTNDLVLCLGEIRGPAAAQALCAAIGRTNLSVAVVSRYRWRDRYDEQQDVILTTLPVVQANWSVWKAEKGVRPPRGYAHARVVVSPAVTASVYAVHLKSNYHATTKRARRENREKRRIAIDQLVAQTRARRGRPASPVVIAGDFNADRWQAAFAQETIFSALSAAGYADAGALLPADRRGTHPSARWGDSTLDYLYFRGFSFAGTPVVLPAEGLSDHRPVFQLVTPGE